MGEDRKTLIEDPEKADNREDRGGPEDRPSPGVPTEPMHA